MHHPVSIRRQRVLAVIAGAFPALDTTVNVAFPAIDDHFGLRVSQLQWIVICYLLTYGALLIAGGRVGDSIGYRRLVWWGGVVSVVGLAGCAAAPTFVTFLFARVVQGVGTALVLAGAPALLTTSTSDSTSFGRGQAVGMFQTATMAGLMIGPLVGGPLVDFLGWRSVFWSRIPVAVILVVLAHGLRAETTLVVAADEDSHDHIDAIEMVLGVAAVAATVAVASLGGSWGWANPWLIGLAIVTACIAVAFVRRNLTSANPMIDPQLWRRPGFTHANIANAVATGAGFPVWLILPALLVDELAVAVIASGVILAVSPAMSALASAWIGRRIDNANLTRLAVVGLAAQAVGMIGLGIVGPTGAIPAIVAGMAVVGAGLGIFVVPNMHQVMASLPLDRQGVAGGLSLMTRTLGIVIAVASFSAILDPIERAHGFSTAFRIIFLVAGALLVAATASSWASGRRQRL